MQQLVVKAVMAESALEKAAATMPMVKGNMTMLPKLPLLTNMGKRLSVCSGMAMPCRAQNVKSNTPRTRKMRLTGRKLRP